MTAAGPTSSRPIFPLVSLLFFLFASHSLLGEKQVPALTAGVVSSRRPRQAGMVIGVVPRYDPHGMGMPSIRPDVAPDGRRRAVSISTVQAREVGGSHREQAATILQFRVFLLTLATGWVTFFCRVFLLTERAHQTRKTIPISCNAISVFIVIIFRDL